MSYTVYQIILNNDLNFIASTTFSFSSYKKAKEFYDDHLKTIPDKLKPYVDDYYFLQTYIEHPNFLRSNEYILNLLQINKKAHSKHDNYLS